MSIYRGGREVELQTVTGASKRDVQVRAMVADRDGWRCLRPAPVWNQPSQCWVLPMERDVPEVAE